MLDNIPDDLLLIIFSKLPNYEITSLMGVNSKIKNVVMTL